MFHYANVQISFQDLQAATSARWQPTFQKEDKQLWLTEDEKGKKKKNKVKKSKNKNK